MEFASCLTEAGWVPGMACSNIYVNEDLDATVSDGDDVHALGEDSPETTDGRHS